MNQQLIDLAKQVAIEHSLEPSLVCAIVEQESAWNPWAIRYEPGFYRQYLAPMHSLTTTEAYSRAFSWGLMQLMGECARENGYGAPLAALCDPKTGLEQGCVHFARKLKLAQGEVAHGLQLWNGGGNAQYSTQVLARVGKYK